MTAARSGGAITDTIGFPALDSIVLVVMYCLLSVDSLVGVVTNRFSDNMLSLTSTLLAIAAGACSPAILSRASARLPASGYAVPRHRQ